MSLVIDEDAVRRIAGEGKGDAYTVTALNLADFMTHRSPVIYPSAVASTVTLELPSMSVDTVTRLLSIREQIVDSGSHLMSTTELDDEIAERKRHT